MRDLWESILIGDRNALAQLFRKFYPPLFNYGLRLIAREDLVKDSIQELFLTIWKQRDQLSDVEYVRSYLYSSLRRTVFSRLERQKSRNERDRLYSRESLRMIFNKEQLIISKELQNRQKEALEKAIQSLSKREKEAIFLKFKDGLSNEEIAQVMEVNKQSVYNYIYRALIALEDYLEKESACHTVFEKNMALLGKNY